MATLLLLCETLAEQETCFSAWGHSVSLISKQIISNKD